MEELRNKTERDLKVIREMVSWTLHGRGKSTLHVWGVSGWVHGSGWVHVCGAVCVCMYVCTCNKDNIHAKTIWW